MEEMKAVFSDVQIPGKKLVALDERQYTVLNMIDYGSFGDIFKVVSDTGSKIYALKQIMYRGDIQDDPYILSELFCLSKLNHRNIIKMHELLVGDGEINIIMEYAENENIERYLKVVGPLVFQDIYSIYGQVLDAVCYCHSMGIAHRDVTPANILLTKDLIVKLADFGLAVKCTDGTGNPVLCSDYLGNVAYLSPEVLSQTPFRPKPADMWSLGILLCYLLFNVIPYKGLESVIVDKQKSEAWRAFVLIEPMAHSEISRPDITGILDGMLHLSPTLRITIDNVTSLWETMATDCKDDHLGSRQS